MPSECFHFPFFRKGKTCRWSEKNVCPALPWHFNNVPVERAFPKCRRRVWSGAAAAILVTNLRDSRTPIAENCFLPLNFTEHVKGDVVIQWSRFPFQSFTSLRAPAEIMTVFFSRFSFLLLLGVREASDEIRSFRFNSSASEIIRRWRFARRSLMA